MKQERQDPRVLPPTTHTHEPDEGVVAAAAARLLVAADRAVSEIRADAEHAPGEARADAKAAGTAGESRRAGEEECVELKAELRDDRAKIAKLDDEVESVESELGPIRSAIMGLQSHSLRLTGVIALVLAVLITIGWKAIGG
jgi:hypothetical protein